MTEQIRIGFMAGRGIPAAEIAVQVGMEREAVSRALTQAGIAAPVMGYGQTIHLIVPIEAFIPEIDDVGRRRKMSREEIACEILRIVFSQGADAIDTILQRGRGGDR